MDNKRKGSASPSRSDSSKWDASPTRDPLAFADDDDGPLPAPPDFDARRGGVPDLLDADEIVEADPELLDSALITEVRPTHAIPPPIPAPVPTGPGPRAFLDDGEIADMIVVCLEFDHLPCTVVYAKEKEEIREGNLIYRQFWG